MKKIILIMMVISLIFLLAACSFFGWNKDKEVDNEYVSKLTTPTSTIPPFIPGNGSGSSIINNTTVPAPTKVPVQSPTSETMIITSYYQDAEGHIIPAACTVEKQVGVARASIIATIDNSVNREQIAYYGLYPVLPRGTEVLGINIKEETAIIDFNKSVLDYDSEQVEKNIISTIVYTLTEYDTIDSVRILVNGYEQGNLKFGADISGLLNRDNCMINSYSANRETGVQKSDIYVYKSVDNRFNYLVPVSVEHTLLESADIPGKLIDLLSNEYSNDKFFSEIPASTKLLDSSITEDVLEIDLSAEIKNYTGSTRENRIVNQVYHTMKQIDGINKIKILIEGAAQKLPEGTNISQTVFLPEKINILD